MGSSVDSLMQSCAVELSIAIQHAWMWYTDGYNRHVLICKVIRIYRCLTHTSFIILVDHLQGKMLDATRVRWNVQDTTTIPARMIVPTTAAYLTQQYALI